MIIKKVKSMREQVYELIKSLIVTGEIKSGERIVEVDYANKFQVSRTPIREALKMLELEGLIESVNGGLSVKSIGEKEIREVYKIRIALESIIVDEIIKNYIDDLSHVDEILEITKPYMIENDNSEKIIELFSEFNKRFYEAARMERVTKLINNINFYTKRFRTLCLTDKGRRTIAFEEHLKIVEYIKNSEIEKAQELNKFHLETSMNFILENINSTKSKK